MIRDFLCILVRSNQAISSPIFPSLDDIYSILVRNWHFCHNLDLFFQAIWGKSLVVQLRF